MCDIPISPQLARWANSQELFGETRAKPTLGTSVGHRTRRGAAAPRHFGEESRGRIAGVAPAWEWSPERRTIPLTRHSRGPARDTLQNRFSWSIFTPSMSVQTVHPLHSVLADHTRFVSGRALTVHPRDASVLTIHIERPRCALTIHTRGDIRTDGAPPCMRSGGTPPQRAHFGRSQIEYGYSKKICPERTWTSVLTVHPSAIRTGGPHPLWNASGI
jgi:hypothetical protein